MAKKQVASVAPGTPTEIESLAARFKDFPAIDVLTRRFLDPNEPGSLPILLKDEPSGACTNTDHQLALVAGKRACQARDKQTGRRCGLPMRTWHLHYCNGAIEGRWAQMKAKGYIPVQVADLRDQEDVSDLVKQKEESGEIYVRRGDRGKEILMKQPLEAYVYIKRKQADARTAQLKSKKALRDELAERAGAELGDEAGETIYRGGIQVESMSRSKTTLGEEARDE